MDIFSEEFRTFVRSYANTREKFTWNLANPHNSEKFKQHCVRQYLRDLEMWTMAKAKADKRETRSFEKADFKGFINVNLTSEHKDAIQKWDLETDDVFDWIASELTGGYKVSFSYNPQNDTVAASIMCVAAKSPNAGYVVNSFAKDIYTALKALMYKVENILPSNWTEFEDAAADIG